MARRFAILLVVAALAGAFASMAWGAVTDFTGKTAQGLPAKVRIGGDGLLRRAVMRWRADCERPHAKFRNRTVFRPPFRYSTKESFAARGRYKVRNSGFVSRVRVGVAGRHPAPHRWKGTLHATVRVRHHGKAYDRCHLPRIHWSTHD